MGRISNRSHQGGTPRSVPSRRTAPRPPSRRRTSFAAIRPRRRSCCCGSRSRVAPILFGLDKFAEVLTDDWTRYLATEFNDILTGSAQDAMHMVGAVEIVAGLVVSSPPASAGCSSPAGSPASSSACCSSAATATSRSRLRPAARRAEPVPPRNRLLAAPMAQRTWQASEAIVAWRERRLAAGFARLLSPATSPSTGDRPARAARLVDRGCPPHLAARILAPLKGAVRKRLVRRRPEREHHDCYGRADGGGRLRGRRPAAWVAALSASGPQDARKHPRGFTSSCCGPRASR